MVKQVRVLIVDDSALVRKMLTEILNSDPEINVIHAANDPYEARDYLVTEKPDVITLDIEMPKMDGVTFLKKYMRIMPTPTLIISSLAERGRRITVEALEAGAVDVITKPKMSLEKFFSGEAESIIRKVKAAARVKTTLLVEKANPVAPKFDSTHLGETTDKVIAIGASTGGVEALARIIPHFPPASPGIVIVQHMPEGFTASFAERLDRISSIRVKEAEDDDRIMPGLALIAPGGDKHLKIERVGGQYRVRLVPGEKVSFNRPSVDFMFNSVAEHVKQNALAVLMTGMGKDGAKGLKKIRDEGGETFIQDEESCVIFGMPGEAQAIGAAKHCVPLKLIPNSVIRAVS